MSLPHWPASLSALPPATRALLTAVLPTCAPDCTDGERLYRCLAAWAVPWRRVPKTLFWRNWHALASTRRRQLLAEGGAYMQELDEDAHWVGAALRRDDVGTLQAALELGGGQLPDLPAAYRSPSYFTPWSHEFEDEISLISRAAAFHGATRCILYLIRKNYEGIWEGGFVNILNYNALDYLALEGRLRCLRAVRRKSSPPISWRTFCTGAAAQGGRLPCLRYLHERGCPWNEAVCSRAASYGQLPCLQYLHEQGCPWSERACSEAAEGGHLPCLRYLHERGCPWNEEACNQAAAEGHLPCLQYLHEHGCPWTEETWNRAAGGGHLSCLQYLHEQGCPWSEQACAWAAGYGHLSCLQYLHEQGCPWDESACGWAAAGGRLHCLRYLHEQGCPWSAKTRAAAAGYPVCLQYLVENGCPEA